MKRFFRCLSHPAKQIVLQSRILYTELMKIYFHRYNSISETGILNAFEALGFEAFQETGEMRKKQISHEERISTLATALLTAKKAGVPFDCVFSVNFFPHIAEVCNKLDTPYLALTVDCPVIESFSRSIALPCCRVFLFDRHQYELLSAFSPDTVFHLPLAADPALLMGLEGTGTGDPNLKEDKVYTPVMEREENCICLVGSLYQEKSPLYRIKELLSEHTKGFIDGLLDAQAEVYGMSFLMDCLSDARIAELRRAAEQAGEDCWPKLSDPICPEAFLDRYIAAHYYLAHELACRDRVRVLNALAEHFDTRVFTNSPAGDCGLSGKVKVLEGVSTYRGMPNVFSHCAINLQPTLRSIETGLSQRVFDVLMCGGFLMSNYQEELYDHFTPGKELAVYSSIPDLVEQCSYYLSHEEERRAVADAGCKLVRSRHTWRERITEMFSKLA